MFGLGFGEMVLILIVGIVVVGPRQLPTLMRTAGRWVSKLRRMSTELRSQSGIDDLIRQEGLEKEIQELRALSRVNVIDTLVSTATGPAVARAAARPAPRPQENRPAQLPGTEPFRDREYPMLGCDDYDALADDVMPYPPPDEPDTAAAEATTATATAAAATATVPATTPAPATAPAATPATAPAADASSSATPATATATTPATATAPAADASPSATSAPTTEAPRPGPSGNGAGA